MPFDKHCEGGMERHIKSDHNMWAYVYYIVHLKSKPSSDLTGTESYILTCFETRDITWIPRMKAICIEGIDIGESEQHADSEDLLNDKFLKWNKHINLLKNSVENLLEKINKKMAEEEEKKNIQ